MTISLAVRAQKRFLAVVYLELDAHGNLDGDVVTSLPGFLRSTHPAPSLVQISVSRHQSPIDFDAEHCDLGSGLSLLSSTFSGMCKQLRLKQLQFS